jgi:hypothetical protein
MAVIYLLTSLKTNKMKPQPYQYPDIWDERKLGGVVDTTDEQIIAMQYADDIDMKVKRLKPTSPSFRRDVITELIKELKTRL